MNNYHSIFFTTLPSFYKVNLYNELSKRINILVVFVGSTSKIREKDFFSNDINFDYKVANVGNIENRGKFFSFIRLLKIILSHRAKYYYFPGWQIIELNLLIPLVKKSKRCLVVESSIHDVSTKNYLWKFKKILINRFERGFPSGKLQSDIFTFANFRGDIYFTHGVGLINRQQYEGGGIGRSNEALNYLYVGRLSHEKNIDMLIDVFNKNGKNLSIVGSGKIRENLENNAKSNITFYGHVKNKDLVNVYAKHDIFILPSLSEPWGLVVDEALYYGLPVLVSEMVGCSDDMVTPYNAGLIFSIGLSSNLNDKIIELESDFEYYLGNAQSFPFKKRENEQVESYII